MSFPEAAQSAPPVRRKARSFMTPFAFLVGVPAAMAILSMVEHGPLNDPLAQRYLSHPVEKVEVLLFCIALGALLAKVGAFLLEWIAVRRRILPLWDGRPIPVGEAIALRSGLSNIGRRLDNTYLVRRIRAVLDFVGSRQSANELDDQLRALADNDAMALENSHSLIRFITWAIPILGFLGTVLGITEAISGVTPEVLEKSLSPVTEGLALAFDTTALALALTMIIMFVNYLVDRSEQGMLDTVDRYVEEQLAHRFERQSSESGALIETMRQQTQVLLAATEKLVERQAAVWAKALENAEKHWQETGQKHQAKFAVALEATLTRTLDNHAERLANLETRAVEHSKELVQQLAGLAQTLRDTGREQQRSLAQMMNQIMSQTAALARLQSDGQQLVQLQDVMTQNLATLTSVGKFDEALHSLTAAIHLLTARAGPRPGVAA